MSKGVNYMQRILHIYIYTYVFEKSNRKRRGKVTSIIQKRYKRLFFIGNLNASPVPPPQLEIHL